MNATAASGDSRVDERAPDALFSAVYSRLKAMARRQRHGGHPGDTLNTTALVHELYLKLVRGRELSFEDPAQFFAYAARAMRHILIDSARARLRDRRDAGGVLLDIGELELGATSATAEQALALDDALRRLETEDPRAARLVELHYFAGLSLPEVAKLMGLTTRTLNRDWRYARAWLQDVLG